MRGDCISCRSHPVTKPFIALESAYRWLLVGKKNLEIFTVSSSRTTFFVFVWTGNCMSWATYPELEYVTHPWTDSIKLSFILSSQSSSQKTVGSGHIPNGAAFLPAAQQTATQVNWMVISLTRWVRLLALPRLAHLSTVAHFANVCFSMSSTVAVAWNLKRVVDIKNEFIDRLSN